MKTRSQAEAKAQSIVELDDMSWGQSVFINGFLKCYDWLAEQEQAEPKPAELTAEDFVRVPATYWCGGCYFDGLEIGCTITDKLSEELGICEGIIFKLKEAAK